MMSRAMKMAVPSHYEMAGPIPVYTWFVPEE